MRKALRVPAVLAGFATAIPKSAEGTVEMIRQLKAAHDTAVGNWSAVMVTLKVVLVHAPEPLTAETVGKTPRMIACHLASLRPRSLETPEDSIRYTLHLIARRWLALDQEIKEPVGMIDSLVMRQAPQLLGAFGVDVDAAAEILIGAGDSPERIKSEAAFVKPAGLRPVLTGSRATSRKHRVNHHWHRQLNSTICGIRHPRVGLLVQQPSAPRAHRPCATRGVRSRVLSSTIRSGHRSLNQTRSSPAYPGGFILS